MIQKAVAFVPAQVDDMLRRLVAALTSKFRSSNGGSRFDGALPPPRSFTYNNTGYVLWTAKDSGGIKVKVGKATGSDAPILTASQFDDTGKTGNDRPSVHFQNLVNAATAYVTAVQSGTATSATLTSAQNAIGAAEDVLIADILANACKALNTGCFAAGTKLWTPQGYRTVETIEPGDLVYARNELDPSGPVEAKVVEANSIARAASCTCICRTGH